MNILLKAALCVTREAYVLGHFDRGMHKSHKLEDVISLFWLISCVMLLWNLSEVIVRIDDREVELFVLLPR